MDETTAEQIRALLTRVGVIMEDARSNALTLTAADAAFVERLDALARVVDAASILLQATAVIYADDGSLTGTA